MKVRRVDFSPDEWIGGTVGLDNAERGLYITACALIYSHGGPIPADELRAACRDHGHAYKRQLNRLLLLGKLTLNGLQIDNKRCANELQKAEERSINGSQNIAKRWAKTKENNDIEQNTVLPASNARARVYHQPSTTNIRDFQNRVVEVAAEMPAQPWEARCRLWAADGFWPKTCGPAPDEPGCYAPADLVAEARRKRAA